MSVKKWFILCSIVIFSTAAYAQKGVTKAVEAAVERQVLNRAKLPTLRDGMRNLVTRRLGVGQLGAPLQYPTRSVLDFGAPLKKQQVRVTELPRIVGARHDERKDGFYSVAKPGSGNIEQIALSAHALIKQVAIAQWLPTEERDIFLKMAEALDNGFTMSADGKWQLIRGYSFAQNHQLIKYFKQQWPEYSRAYGGAGDTISKGLKTALEVLDIQTWMLTHNGKFPTYATSAAEAELAWTFNELIEEMGTNPTIAADPSVQGAVQHLVHLRAAAQGAMTPLDVLDRVLKHLDNGGRIPGSSVVNMDPAEEQLTRELNYVEQLRRANLLYLLIPMKRSQDVVELYMTDFQEKGHIYRQMIERIPEFAHDGLTLNVPTYSHVAWKAELNNWQAARKAAGLSTTPRSKIMGRFGLPVNFNDLTKDEQTEVLLGTYLKIK